MKTNEKVTRFTVHVINLVRMDETLYTIDLVERTTFFSVKCNIVILCIQTYCVCPLARRTIILSTRPAVVLGVPLTLGTLLYMYLSTSASGRHVVESSSKYKT